MTICNFIKFSQYEIWYYLSDVFRLNLKAAELGLTDDLVYRITNFYGGRPANCEVYIVPAENEIVRGADIDLFIFNGSLYDHYMIQAKVMNFSGVYKDIKNYANDAQFCKLIEAAQKVRAFPLYLLYSGETKGSNLGNYEYGYATIWAKKIRDFRLKQKRKLKKRNIKAKTKKKNIPLIRFNDLKADLKPFSCLFCPECITDFETPFGKKYEEIYKDYPYLNIYDLTDIVLDRDSSNIQRDDSNRRITDTYKPEYFAPIRIIITDETIYNNRNKLNS